MKKLIKQTASIIGLIVAIIIIVFFFLHFIFTEVLRLLPSFEEIAIYIGTVILGILLLFSIVWVTGFIRELIINIFKK